LRPSLYPSQIPSIPPTPEKITEENENALSPHKSGMYAPAVPPIVINIQMSDFIPLETGDKISVSNYIKLPIMFIQHVCILPKNDVKVSNGIHDHIVSKNRKNKKGSSKFRAALVTSQL